MMRRRTRQNSRTAREDGESPVATRTYIGWYAIAGSVLLWMAFPPLGWTLCAWIAPVPWLRIARSPEPMPCVGHWKLYCSGVLFWLAMLQGIRLAHPANYLGLLALSLYLAVYLPSFVGLVRGAVHLAGAPLWLAAPVVWTALELARGYLFTGFSLGLLGHTQSSYPWLIQISDLCGAYGVSWLVMVVAAALSEFAPGSSARRRWLPAAFALLFLAASGAYGAWRLMPTLDESPAPLRVALLQGTRDKVFEFDPELERKGFQEYFDLMQQARDAGGGGLDLIVWPEAAFTGLVPEILVEDSIEPPTESGLMADEMQQRVAITRQLFGRKVHQSSEAANQIGHDGERQSGRVHLLVGVTSLTLSGGETRQHNSALLIDPQGNIVARYHKMHPVMFGEYVPFARVVPWLARLTPIGAGLYPGTAPMFADIQGHRLCPNICFESTVPHLIRRQVRRVRGESGKSPDVLVNISDDGWFFGSSILDLHLACGVFRAVEMRRPFLIASNTGISAVIDGNGRIEQRLPHQSQGKFLVAPVVRDGRFSGYVQWGDAFAGLCLLASLGWLARAWFVRRSRRAVHEPGSSPA